MPIMKVNRRTAIIGAATFAALRPGEAATPGQAEVPKPTTQPSLTTERVLGIGGFFFRSHNPQQLADWYQLHLGIDPVPTDYSHHPWQQAAGPTAFATFSMTTKYLGPPEQMFMLNFRVRSLDAMVAQLQKAGIEVKVDPEKYPNGRFARLHDPEGNPIELWEPATPS